MTLSLLNLPAAVPRSTDVTSLLAQAQMLSPPPPCGRRQRVYSWESSRLRRRGDAVDIARDAVQAILGGDLMFVVGFPVVEATSGELAQAMAAEPELLASANLTKVSPSGAGSRGRRAFGRCSISGDAWHSIAPHRASRPDRGACRSFPIAPVIRGSLCRPAASRPEPASSPSCSIASSLQRPGSRAPVSDEWAEDHPFIDRRHCRRDALRVALRSGAAEHSARRAAVARRQLEP